VDVAFCQIVEAHFFRGRFSLTAAKAANHLEADRFVDQLLMYAGIVSHYYPMNETVSPPEEKGIDVWLALEAYDLAVHKRFDVLTLIAGD
jgi:NYN domain